MKTIETLAPTSGATWEQAVLWLRAQPNMQSLVEDGYYGDPLTEVAKRYWSSEEWAAARALLPRAPGRALDVGAGRGIASYALAMDGFRVVALEPDSSAVVGAEAIRSLTRETKLPIEVVESWSERLPLPDQHFDLVFVRAALHHTGDLSLACREFFRVLKPGGTLLAAREHVISRKVHLQAFLERHPLHRYYGGENAFLLSEYKRAIRDAGFALERVICPLDSALNLAPDTIASLQAKIAVALADRLRSQHIGAAVEDLLATPLVWPTLRAVLRLIDHRPGRLYSFLARRK